MPDSKKPKARPRYSSLWSIVALGFILSTTSGQVCSPPPMQVIVPNLVGLVQAEAVTALEVAQLVLGDVDGISDESIPEGNILTQAPLAEAEVDSGSPVNIVVSLGPGPKSYFVSSSEGDDENNDGRTEGSPFKTVAHAISKLRDGTADSMFLKRGDVWEENLGHWTKSGLSEDARMVVGAYGDEAERPLLNTGTRVFLKIESFEGENTVRHLTVEGIHAIADQHTDVRTSSEGIFILGPLDDLIIDDCFIERYQGNSIQGRGDSAVGRIILRRSIIADNFSTESHSQGLYVFGVDDILIEDCLIDHNGWSGPEDFDDPPTQFNHNVYVQSNTTGLIFRRNIVTRASATGIQARPGGLVVENLFIEKPIAVNHGVVVGGTLTAGGVTGEVSNNVILNGNDITGFQSLGVGIQTANISADLGGVVVANNIIAHSASAESVGRGINVYDFGLGAELLTIENNIVYNWPNGIDFREDGGDGEDRYGTVLVRNNDFQDVISIRDGQPRPLIRMRGQSEVSFSGNAYHSLDSLNDWFRVNSDPAFLSFDDWVTFTGETDGELVQVSYADPNRNIESYDVDVLGGDGTLDSFVEAVKLNFLEAGYTAADVIAYIQEGFAVAK